MKKLLLTTTVLFACLFTMQAQPPNYPFYENFDAMTAGVAPTGSWTTTGFKVTTGHGNTVPNACSVEMMASHTSDMLVTPSIGLLTGTSIISLDFRFVNAALYPATGTQLHTGDKVTIDAYVFSTWFNAVATIDSTAHPAPLTTWTTFTYTNGAASGQYLKLRVNVARATGDWFLDIDNFYVKDQGSAFGVSYNPFNPPAAIALPNPSQGNFVLWLKNYQNTSSVDVKLYNHMGQLIKTMSPGNVVNNQFDVNTADMAKGVYFVEVTNGNEHATTKVIVE